MREYKIIQIIPTSCEMYAVFTGKPGVDDEEEFRDRVVFLALVEDFRDENDRSVVGFISEGSWFSDPEGISNFDRYEFKKQEETP